MGGRLSELVYRFVAGDLAGLVNATPHDGVSKTAGILIVGLSDALLQEPRDCKKPINQVAI